ncbi:DEP domain-containing protein 1A isoform X1 [Mirounga angustirostris]|uniref:DEP domain-containing protein 1A isoform X1 n=1 Tax=Mirounga leonina TaxID=9715 RepID=UPI00156BE06A|nr:DEP domain-containing protein 1A isoform X1 [Mirounga leonina]XP_045753386.1 DEP domain-containing protein 1A isoform X2 [Mirounga angustirostris]
MASRSVPPGPYRATKLWNEITTSFRAGMPLRKHRQHFKKYGSCFTAEEAVDWLYDLLRNNNNFGPEVTRQQTLQLLRKFLKNHVIEDIKGRWGSENLDDNSQLFRFPANSPLKSLPRRHPELRKNSIENFSKDKDSIFKLRNLSRRTPKKLGLHFSQENTEKMNHEMINEDQENSVDNREISQEDVEEVWRYVILIYLQTILGVPSLEELINPKQVVPQYVMYNMTNTSKHGIVILQDKSDDLPHWVLSAMKCLANWPRNNDMSNPTYVGFERDVFRTIADYFLDLPEPLLTFEYYELFVSILVVCGYVTVSDRSSGIHKIQDDPQSSKILRLNNLNSFKSTECLLLSLLHKDKNKEESDTTKRLQISDQGFQEKCAKKMELVNFKNRRASANDIMGGSCHNLIGLSSMHVLSSNIKPRCHSLEGIIDLPGSSSKEVFNVFHQSVLNIEEQNNKQFLESKTEQESLMNLHSEESNQKPLCVGFKRTSTLTVQDQEELCNGKCKSKQLCRSQSLLLRSSTRRNSYINMPVAEITVKPNLGQGSTSVQTAMESELGESSTTINKRLCKSTIELSENSLSPASSVLTGTQSLLQPHLERVAIDALQLCCLLLPPPNRRKLQLLMRMISRMSQNVDMPQLHDAMGTRSLMINTFSRCVLCCAEEVDLDELLAARLVSFLMDHHQEILQVPSYLQTAVDKHLDYLKKGYIKNPRDGLIVPLPTYSYCKQISAREFDEQKVSTSQAAIAELLENIIKNKSLPLKEKRKKLKQFQKEYPLIYQKRFPTTESEAVLFGDKPTIKQPMLILKKSKFRSLRY